MRRLDWFAHDIRCQLWIFHQRAALAVAHNLWDWTAHIDIQHGIAAIACQLTGCTRYNIRLMTEELKRHRPFFLGRNGEQFTRSTVILGREHIALGADHFTDRHRAAHFMAEHAERHICYAGHGRKHRALFEKIKIRHSSICSISCRFEIIQRPAVRVRVTR